MSNNPENNFNANSKTDKLKKAISRLFEMIRRNKFSIPENDLLKLSQKLGGTLDDYVITRKYKKKTFILTYTDEWNQGSDYIHPAELTFSTGIDLNSGFIIFKEDYLDKVAKFFGLKTEFQTGYENFDKKYFIKVDDEKSAKKMFADIRIRKQVNWFFLKGFKCISCSGDTLEISLFPFVFSIKNEMTLRKVFQKLFNMSTILTQLVMRCPSDK
jgi:hypothetical protein